MSVHKVTPRPQKTHSGYGMYQPPTPPEGKRVRHLGGPGGERRTFAELPALFGQTVRKQAGPTKTTPGR